MLEYRFKSVVFIDFKTHEDDVKNITIVGGTHGNEYTGIYLIQEWENEPEKIARDTFQANTFFANPMAFQANQRYLDEDLNRQFIDEKLNQADLANYEQSRAKVIHQTFGPKGNSQTDLIIDLHNTTSHMGPTLVLLRADSFNLQLAAYILKQMPDANILFEDHCSIKAHGFLCSIAKQGVIIEVGPQPQSVLRHDIFNWMNSMTHHVLDFVDLYNKKQLPQLPNTIEAYRYTETLSLPLDSKGMRIGMVHEYVQDQDFKMIQKGDPIFQLFNGETLYWQGDYEAYPHFINEAAYYDNNLAMSLAKKCLMRID